MNSESSAKIETVLQEERVFNPSSADLNGSAFQSLDQYRKIAFSAKLDPEKLLRDLVICGDVDIVTEKVLKLRVYYDPSGWIFKLALIIKKNFKVVRGVLLPGAPDPVT